MSATKTLPEITESHTIAVATMEPDAPLGSVTITEHVQPAEEYVVGGPLFWNGANMRVLPWTIDDLTQDFGDTVYERMLWDPVLKAAHSVIKKSVLAQGLKVIPAILDKSDPRQAKAQAIAERIRRNLRRIRMNDVMLNMADGMAYGNKIAEKVWGYEERGTDKGTTVLAALKVKSRRTVAFTTDRYLNIVGILAINPGTGQPVLVGALFGALNITGTGLAPGFDPDKAHVLPREKFAIYTHEPQDSDPRGSSYLRAAYTAWWGKMQLYPEYLRYLAQFGSPSLIGYTPPNASTAKLQDGSTGSAQQAMQQSLLGLRNASVVIFPAGSKVEGLMAHVQARDFGNDFAHFNREMTTAVMHQQGSTGDGTTRESIGAAQAHQDIMGTIVRFAKMGLCDMVEQDIFTPMVLYNEGEEARDLIPTASYGETNEVDLAKLYAAVGQLGFELSPSQFSEIDQALGLPQRSPEELAVLTERATTLPPVVDPTLPSPQQQRVNPQTVDPATGGVVKGGSPPGRTNQNKNAASKTAPKQGGASG